MKNNNYEELVPLFSVPVFHTICNDWSNKKTVLLDLMKNYEFENVGNVTTTYSEKNNFGINLELNKKLEEIFSVELNSFQEKFNFPYFSIENSWFQVEKQGMNHEIHNHGIGVSAICYLEYNKKYHKPVNFVSPHFDVFDGSLEIISLSNIDEGSLILFPSIISHFTHKNTSEHERKVVAFNINILPHQKTLLQNG